MVSKGNHPQMAARFRLVKYYNLPRYVIIHIIPIHIIHISILSILSILSLVSYSYGHLWHKMNKCKSHEFPSNLCHVSLKPTGWCYLPLQTLASTSSENELYQPCHTHYTPVDWEFQWGKWVTSSSLNHDLSLPDPNCWDTFGDILSIDYHEHLRNCMILCLILWDCEHPKTCGWSQVVLHKAWEVLSAGRPGRHDLSIPFFCGAIYKPRIKGDLIGNIMEYYHNVRPRSIAMLVPITPITMVYGTYNYS